MKFPSIIIAVAFAAALLLFGCAGLQELKACTADAKICPDGSAVWRTGPNCEFAPCPAPTVNATPPANNSTGLHMPITKITLKKIDYDADREYVLMADGSTYLNETMAPRSYWDPQTGNSTVTYGAISKERFAAVAKILQDGGFWGLDDLYSDFQPGMDFAGPRATGEIFLKVESGNATKTVHAYTEAKHPKILDDAIAAIQSAYADSLPNVSGITKELCESARGHWNECASACRGALLDQPCTLQCVQECECGGIAGFGCPSGYECMDYLPAGAADAMGVCKLTVS